MCVCVSVCVYNHNIFFITTVNLKTLNFILLFLLLNIGSVDRGGGWAGWKPDSLIWEDCVLLCLCHCN